MPLSWNEIKNRAIAFSQEWADETSEDAEAKSFWDGWFRVFGISRRRVATFEQSVKKADNKQGFIDLLWKGTILVEHKSRGKSLDKAMQQAKDYFPGLKEHELPKYILVSDFQKFRLYDLDTDATVEFELKDFVQQVHLFGFIAGYEQRTYKDSDPVNIEAAELMGKLHDRLEDIGYTGHDLEVYLVRLLFCLFADDTGIFEKGIFWEYLDLHTKSDGSDLAMHIASIFHILNTPRERRLKNLDENLAQFPYVIPENISDKQKQKVETAAQTVLDTRAKYPDSSLADLYDSRTMPPDLVKAHQILDKAVDLCYRPQVFINELNRIEFLFGLYETLNTPLLKPEKKKRSKKS